MQYLESIAYLNTTFNIKVPAPVPNTAIKKPEIKNRPSKGGSEALPIRPPIIKSTINTAAYITIASLSAIFISRIKY